MQFRTPTKRRLGAIATICLLSVALPTTSAWAQKTKTKPAPVAETTTPAPAPEITVDIPTIQAIGSNVDEATLRDIFSGNVIDHADALAGLTATSITIPEITLQVDGTTDSTVVYAGIVLTNVQDGIAESVTLSSMNFTEGSDASGEFGAASAKNFDIGGILRLYGMVDGAGQTELKTIYTDFSFDGGTFTAPEVSCTFGAATAAEVKARPIKYSFADIMSLAQDLSAEDDDPSPQTIGKALHIYADLFTAFASSPMQFDGFDCNGVDDNKQPIEIAVGGMTVGAMSPGTYPGFEFSDLSIQAGEEGSFTMGQLNLKPIDISAPIATIQAAPDSIDEAWFEANARALVPAFAGLSISDVSMDIPDPESEADRIVAGLGNFDLSLSDYVNGIPSVLNTTASNIRLQLPADTSDEQLQMLMALGIDTFDLGFTIDANWDEASNTIAVNQISLTGADLGTIKLAATLNNATEGLFDSDENMVMAAAMGLALGNIKLDVNDAGISDIILAIASADQGADPATMRPVFAGLAEGTIIGMLPGVAEAQQIGTAVSTFIAGKSKNLTIDVTAKQKPGLSMLDLMAAEDDPTALIGKVNIDASN